MRYTWDNMTTIQYQRLLKNGDSKKPEDLLCALTGKKKNEITISEIESLRIGSITPKHDPIVAQIFMGEDGVLYGLQDLNDMPFGLFDDLMSIAADVKIHLSLMVSYLYRPISKMSFMSTMKLRIISKFGHKTKSQWFRRWIIKSMNTLKYEIEPYDPLKCESRSKTIDSSQAYIAHHVVTFFLILSRELQKSSLVSLRNHLKEMKTQLHQITLEENLKQP